MSPFEDLGQDVEGIIDGVLIEEMTVPQLKEALKERGLKVFALTSVHNAISKSSRTTGAPTVAAMTSAEEQHVVDGKVGVVAVTPAPIPTMKRLAALTPDSDSEESDDERQVVERLSYSCAAAVEAMKDLTPHVPTSSQKRERQIAKKSLAKEKRTINRIIAKVAKVQAEINEGKIYLLDPGEGC